MITINNLGNLITNSDFDKYEIKINEKHITTFLHKRSDGLSKCLEIASISINPELKDYND